MLAIAAAACVALAVVSVGSGPAGVPLARALPALVGIGDRFDLLVVRELQGPRVVAAIVAGLALGLAGALFQSTLRNPLASPDLLGVSGGASLGAVTAVVGYGASGLVVTGAALVGGLGVALAIWLLAWRGGLHGVRFVLVGVGLAYVCSSLVAWRLAQADLRDAGTVLLWTVGSVADVRDGVLGALAAAVAVLAIAAALLAGAQRPLALGDDHARAMGLAPGRSRGLALLVGVALVAAAVAVAGPVAFVALLAPALARRLVDDGGPALLASAALGALIVLAADVAGQIGVGGVTAPVGVVTGLVGAPYLLLLLARADRGGTS